MNFFVVIVIFAQKLLSLVKKNDHGSEEILTAKRSFDENIIKVNRQYIQISDLKKICV